MAALLVPISGYTAPPPVADFVFNWVALMVILGGIWVLVETAKMMQRGVRSPLSELFALASGHRSRLVGVAAGFILTGTIQLAFNWIKPQLAKIFPFWADGALAAIDARLFLGVDPWIVVRRLIGEALPFFDWVYSLWYPTTLIALFGALVSNRSIAITAYFLLWGVFGPLVQIPLSSAGPIFWSRIGLGQRFDGLSDGLPFGTDNAADYLWRNHVAQTNDIAVGISAMPSMHVAMAAWIALTYMRTPLALIGLAYWVLVLIGSVALGWHYAVDGIVGTIGAGFCFVVAGFLLNRTNSPGPARQAFA